MSCPWSVIGLLVKMEGGIGWGDVMSVIRDWWTDLVEKRG